MYRILDIENWNRKEHFQFFSQMDEPFFGIVAEIDCTDAYSFCKQNKMPFFMFYLHKAIIAVNQVEEFRYRIRVNEIIIFDTIHVTSTVRRTDNTFAFSFIPYSPSFKEFTEFARVETDNIKNSKGLRLSEDTGRKDVIHFSAVPWISFSGVTHPRNFKIIDSIPKITFGKYFQRNRRLIMSVSINAHHGLMDGYHVGKYLQLFEILLNDKSV